MSEHRTRACNRTDDMRWVERCAVQFAAKAAHYYGKKESSQEEGNKEEAPLTHVGGKHVLLCKKKIRHCRIFFLQKFA